MAPSDLKSSPKKSLKDLASENPTQIGDPVSLKAETSNTQPTEHDMPNKADRARPVGGEGAKEGEQANRSQLGDPVSLKAEPSGSEPTEEDRGARGTEGKNGKPKM
ncbi:uncharacterized protein LTR77_006853 [Saxophila tyrrhenica]|uniref:Uncharacterized protein n=1 Tax=Saxophila tyrrhenica TaxID=1690608 RepID=A0AAV9P5Z6_9PEZI|nr:hypothetical protein LTR77_006853 [Saxophila tyrrhenica]